MHPFIRKRGPLALCASCLASLGSTALAAEPEAEEETYEAVAEVEAPPRQPTERVLEAEELVRVPGTLGDPLRAVEILPGVSRSTEGEPLLRGSSGHESASFIDGATVPFLYHFGGVRSVVHPRLIERVAVYPGNFSARYGRATGGIVEARLRDPKSDGLHGELELSLIDSSLLVETPLTDDLSLAVAARRSNIDFVFDAFVPEDTFNVVVAPLYWDYQTILSYRPSESARLRLTLTGARDETTLVFSEPSSEDAALRGSVGGSVQYHRAQLSYEDRSGGVKQELQVIGGFQNFEQQVGPNGSAYFDVVDFGGRAEWSVPLGQELELIGGLDVLGQSFKGAYRGSAAPALEGANDVPNSPADQIVIEPTHFWLIDPAAYVEARYFPSSRWLLVPGLRVDYYHQTRAVSVDPRLSARFLLSDALTLKSAVGWYSQPPEYYETLPEIGNPKLDPYHALHVSAGAELELGDHVSLDAEGFYKYLTDRVVATEGSTPPRFINDGRGRVLGLEFGASYRQDGGLRAQLAYTLSRSERQDRSDSWRSFDSDQTHVLSLAAGYPLGRGWHAGARFRFVTGNPVTPVLGSIYDAGADLYYPLYGRQNSERNPAFQQLDLRIEKSFTIGSGSLAIYLDVQNVYVADNPEGYIYSYDYSESEVATGGAFFPNLGLRGEL